MSKVGSESPFYEVLDEWGRELILIENGLPEGVEPTLNKYFTLKSGVQVILSVGRDLYQEGEDK